MTSAHISAIELACAASGHTPAGATTRAKLEDACAFVDANAAPEDEGELWAEAVEACKVVKAFFAGR